MNELLVDRLKSARIASGLKQQDVAEKMGIKANTISNWEKGRTEPDIDSFVKLCDIYKIDCASLLSDVYAFDRIGTDISLTEYDHIKKYRDLDDQGKEHVDSVLDWETERTVTIRDLKSKAGIITNREMQEIWDEIPKTPEELERMYPLVKHSVRKKDIG
ncbi:helix-turn-helix domain-containing protein [Hungatella hathewayi]|uniref:helix-turn-helix domain-containing protein n=1 Tax=Hungatella hathewayi TaxID=154046 RepID=UPI0006C33AA0|nr:helix-turn-helix transcriptional regulator [Hungatella hathewayi]CUP47853.1 transcriptional regulator [Hungatella hathewayi]